MIGTVMHLSAMAPTPLSAPPSNHPPSSSSPSMRSQPPVPLQPLSLGLLPLPPSSASHRHDPPEAIPAVALVPAAGGGVARVRLSDMEPYEGSPCGVYAKAVEAFSGSLTRHNAAVIELGCDDSAIVRCALESVRMYFRARAGLGKPGRGVYTFRAGRPVEDGDLAPPCMGEAFRCLGKAARATLCAMARHLRMRSDVFNHLLDDTPLPSNEVSSSVLVACYSSQPSPQSVKGSLGGGKMNGEVEKGLLTLIASDSPGVQVCDPNGRWYVADGCSGPGDLLLLTGKALSHVTAGLRPAATYRSSSDYTSNVNHTGRVSLTFRLMPQGNAVLDCSPIAAAGHVIPQSFIPISVSRFMDDLSAEEEAGCSHPDNTCEVQTDIIKEPSLRSVLSDPLSGAFLEDAVLVSCGHSFGGQMLNKIMEMGRCTICNAEIEAALRAAAKAVKLEDDRRLFHNAALRKRRKEFGEQMESQKRTSKENGEMAADGDSPRQHRGVQYPFAVSEKVLIKGNRRTPDKFVGREAVITSQCLNGWYLLKILDSGENVRLQYRSLQKLRSSQADDNNQPQPSIQNGV
ncbi:U-box domain-containing protein 63 [Acorus calamus]|uniref:U-box domain-containing protein 63 n=1 Tax=Acorus calamus TaxID=4465 RepID=A0AAV9DPK1_ACOCL|nr:U-box domain-containing protein 63 [Acorus calamus]